MSHRVLDLVAGRVSVSGAPLHEVNRHPRVSVLVHYSESPVLSRSVIALVDELRRANYVVVIASACEASGNLEWRDGAMPPGVVVVRKPNIGYDFGSVAVALDALPWILDADRVLIVNDSSAGPFSSLSGLLTRFDDAPVDAWAATSSSQHGHHLQSFFLGFKNGVLRAPAVRAFWRGIEHLDDKREIILRYEIGLTRLLTENGWRVGAEFTSARWDAASAANLALDYWLELLLAGYPFVKRELVMRPNVVPTAVLVPATIERMFGEDVVAWL